VTPENDLDTALASLANQLADLQFVVHVLRELHVTSDSLHRLLSQELLQLYDQIPRILALL
jgi:hypothetical protein